MPSKPSEKKAQTEIADAELSFEEAMAALEAIVQEMAAGDLPLEKLVSSHERAAALLRLCEGRLAEARERISLIEGGDGGEPVRLRGVTEAELAAAAGVEEA